VEIIKASRKGKEFSDRHCVSETPSSGGSKIILRFINFEPWQSMHMQRNASSDTILYFVDGNAYALLRDGVMLVGPKEAVYVPKLSSYGILADENDLTVVAIHGPSPIIEQIPGVQFQCPECGLEAPLTTDTTNGEINMCPRCETMVKLTKGPERFLAEKTTEGTTRETTQDSGTLPESGIASFESGSSSEPTFTDPQTSSEQPHEQPQIDMTIINFEPWQSMPMQRNVSSDTMLYIVRGQGIAFVEDDEQSVKENEAIHIPTGSAYALLAADNHMIVMMAQGPIPVEISEVKGFEYFCPACGLETPVTTNTWNDCITVCPRCNIKLQLKKTEQGFLAEETTEKAPTQAEAQ